MKYGDVMRSWRLPDGSLLVEVACSYEPSFHHLRDDRLVRSYIPSIADDCELMYVYGHRVIEDRLEYITHVEVGYPYRRDVVKVGETIFEGLVELPPGGATRDQLARAGVPEPWRQADNDGR
jgi:hypothetical protein